MNHLTAAQKQRGVRIHAIVFGPTMALLLVINLLTGSPYWSVWAVLPAWGIGLLCHWFFVLGPGARKAETT